MTEENLAVKAVKFDVNIRMGGSDFSVWSEKSYTLDKVLDILSQQDGIDLMVQDEDKNSVLFFVRFNKKQAKSVAPRVLRNCTEALKKFDLLYALTYENPEGGEVWVFSIPEVQGAWKSLEL